VGRRQSDNRHKAFELYEKSGGTKLCKDIAAALGVSDSQVRNWKVKDKWNDKVAQSKNIVAQLKKKPGGAPKGNRNAAGHGAPKGNKNALGNRGGHGGPPGNKKGEKHGFFAKIFPDDEETREIIAGIQTMSPLDILWDQIVIQYTAIARAQKIMWVRDQEDKTIERVGEQWGKIIGEKWEVQHAWDKHASFLQAQSRAIQTLERLIARYEELLLKDLQAEEQQLRIDKLKAELDKIKNPMPEAEIGKYIEALKGTAEDVWSEDEPDQEGEDDKEDDSEGEADN